jgi:nitroreductase
MDTFEAISTRRSVKKYDPEHRMAQEEIDRLMSAVILSPTSYNIQNWRFVLVTDPAVKQRLRDAGHGQSQFTDASLVVIVCGDRGAYAKDTERYWANVPEETRKLIVGMIMGAYSADPAKPRDENFRSGGLASMTLMLAARAMGYDTCPMVGMDFDQVAGIIKLPADHDIIMAIAVGKALEPARERAGQVPLDEVCFENSF